jgi:hypothetical protein
VRAPTANRPPGEPSYTGSTALSACLSLSLCLAASLSPTEQRTRSTGAGCRVQGSGFRVQGSGFRVKGSGFRVQGSDLVVVILVFIFVLVLTRADVHGSLQNAVSQHAIPSITLLARWNALPRPRKRRSERVVILLVLTRADVHRSLQYRRVHSGLWIGAARPLIRSIFVLLLGIILVLAGADVHRSPQWRRVRSGLGSGVRGLEPLFIFVFAGADVHGSLQAREDMEVGWYKSLWALNTKPLTLNLYKPYKVVPRWARI